MSTATEEQIEAAARVFYDSQCGPGYDTSTYKSRWDTMAKRAINAALSASASAHPADEHHDAEERVLYYGRTVRNGVHIDRRDDLSDAEWHQIAMADTGTSHNLPGRLYIVQCEWCPKAFAAETKAEAMEMFRAHEKTVQEETR